MSQPDSPTKDPAYGWVIVILAALAMIATMPGRTHGLGIITERLLSDETLGLSRQSFAMINFWATLIGAAFCIPAGWMLDRMGSRPTAALVVALLGIVVLAMTRATGVVQFAILILLTRGLGQSALSVVSISMTGKWFQRRLPLATAVYSVVVSMGFMAAFIAAMSYAKSDWRVVWSFEGYVLLFFCAPWFAILIRSAPTIELADNSEFVADNNDFTLTEALQTPAFWMYGLATALYGLVSSGTSLFNESILVERQFPPDTFYKLSMFTTLIGLATNLTTGWLITRLPISFVAAMAMSLLSLALLSLPFITTYPQLVCYAIGMGCSGGMVTVLFFAVWAKLYGRSHLGRIQSIAQMLTVFASALGPVILAEVKVRLGSYQPAMIGLGLVTAAFAAAVAFVPPPKRNPIHDDFPLEPAIAS